MILAFLVEELLVQACDLYGGGGGQCDVGQRGLLTPTSLLALFVLAPKFDG